MKLKQFIKYFLSLSIIWFVSLAFSIYRYSKHYSNRKSDVAIVLGAGSHKGEVSPLFRERLNNAFLLYDTGKVDYIIITGGFGKNETVSDSKAGRNYILSKGVLNKFIFTEEVSKFTQTNIINAKAIMMREKWNSALIVSDPLHMKRAIAISLKQGIHGKSCPTQTSMYKSWYTKFSFLCYETCYYTIDLILGHI